MHELSKKVTYFVLDSPEHFWYVSKKAGLAIARA